MSDDPAWTGETTADGTSPSAAHGLDTVRGLPHRGWRPVAEHGRVHAAGSGHRDLAALPILPAAGILESSPPMPRWHPVGGTSPPTRSDLVVLLDPTAETAAWGAPGVIGTLLADANPLDELAAMAVVRVLAALPVLSLDLTAPPPPHQPAETSKPVGWVGSIPAPSSDRSAAPWPRVVVGLRDRGPSPVAPRRARTALEFRSLVSPAVPRRAEADESSTSDLVSGSSLWTAILATPPVGVPHPWRWQGRPRAMRAPVRASPTEPPG